MMADVDAGRWAELMAPRYAAATTTLCLGVILFAFNEFIVTTAIPSTVRDLGGVDLISWSLTVHLVFSIVGGAAAAVLKIRHGARAALIGGAAVFLVGSVAVASAGSMPAVLMGRAIQGFGDGLIAALCYTLIPDLFPPRLMPKVFGAEALMWAIAAFGGPILAGLLTEWFSWRAAFLINVPMAVVFILLVLSVVPKTTGDATAGSVPLVRLTGIGCGILLVSVASILPSALQAGALVAAALAVLALMVRRDRLSAVPLFPRDAFTGRAPVGPGLWMVLLMPVAQAFVAVYLVMTLQSVWGYGPTLAGAFSGVMALSWSAVALVVATLAAGRWRATAIRLGPVFQTGGLAAVAAGFSLDQPALVFAGQMAAGAGFGMSWAFLSQTIMDGAGDGDRARASALLPTLHSAGYALGGAVAGLTANGLGYGAAASPDAVRAVAEPLFSAALAFSLAAVVTSRSIGRG
ncbi:MFS transporter [Chthonobacter rhizosphaerae]|uniref:MFS transporter n=1 Tax=Chthonobacter rhizosphaerae TaxID=2735553 RepID=UPI0015EF648D|nr:MFS transporter [Chthonobacter rhizosphaerae]